MVRPKNPKEYPVEIWCGGPVFRTPPEWYDERRKEEIRERRRKVAGFFLKPLPAIVALIYVVSSVLGILAYFK